MIAKREFPGAVDVRTKTSEQKFSRASPESGPSPVLLRYTESGNGKNPKLHLDMTYQDLLAEVGGATHAPGTLSTRAKEDNPNHHLWNNRGTWWCHFTVHRADYTAERIRVSLRTRDVEQARARRDELLSALAT